MPLFDTKYPNNSRVVSGTPQLYNDDVILLCDTSVGPVNINLLDIPPGRWNTNWKLYIVDNSSNASVNNITITAGGTQLINTQATLVLNTNDGGAMIRIVSDTAFLGTLLFTSGGAGTDELIKITGADTTADFLQPKLVAGTNVTFNLLNPGANEQLEINSTASGADEKVKVTGADTTEGYLADKIVAGGGITLNTLNPGADEDLEISSVGGSVVPITGANMLTLVNTSSVVVGALYLIEDATYTNGGVYVRGLSSNSISREGRGIFLNIDYQNTLGNFVGTWRSTIGGLVAGTSEVSWDGQVYQSITGVNTATTPDADAVNWLLLDRTSSPTSYITEIDFVIYNLQANEITMRQDKRKNIVEAYESTKPPFMTMGHDWFKWGDDRVCYNKAINGGWIRNTNWDYNEPAGFSANVCDNYGYIDAYSGNGRIIQNSVTNAGYIDVNNFSAITSRYNFVDGGGIHADSSSGGEASNNNLKQSSHLYLNNLVGGSANNNQLGQRCVIRMTSFNTGDVSYNILDGNTTNVAYGSNGSLIDLENATMFDCTYNRLNSSSAIFTNAVGTPGVRARFHYNDLNGLSEVQGVTLAQALIQNNVLSNESIMNVASSVATIEDNILTNSCNINADTSTIDAVIKGNNLTNSSSITATTLLGTITDNILTNSSTIIGTTLTASGVIDKNILTNDGSINAPNIAGTIRQNVCKNTGHINAQVTTQSITITDNEVETDSTIDVNNALSNCAVTRNKIFSSSQINADINDGTITLNVLYDSSSIVATNNAGTIGSNELWDRSTIACANSVGAHNISRNKLTNLSSISSDANAGQITDNVLENTSSISSANNQPTGIIRDNIVLQNSVLSAPTNSSIIGQWSDAQLGNYLNHGNLTITNNAGSVGGNYITAGSTLSITTNNNDVYDNKIHGNGILSAVTNGFLIGHNILNTGTINLGTPTANVIYQAKTGAGSTWILDVDMNDVAFFSGTRLTLSLYSAYGIIRLTNCNGKTLNQITGASTYNDQTLINYDTTGSFTLNTGTIAGAGADPTLLLSNSPAIAGALVAGHTNNENGDWIKVRRWSGGGNPVVTEINIFP